MNLLLNFFLCVLAPCRFKCFSKPTFMHSRWEGLLESFIFTKFVCVGFLPSISLAWDGGPSLLWGRYRLIKAKWCLPICLFSEGSHLKGHFFCAIKELPGKFSLLSVFQFLFWRQFCKENLGSRPSFQPSFRPRKGKLLFWWKYTHSWEWVGRWWIWLVESKAAFLSETSPMSPSAEP